MTLEEFLNQCEEVEKKATKGFWRWGDWKATFGDMEDPDNRTVLESWLQYPGDACIISKKDSECNFVLYSTLDFDPNENDKVFITYSRNTYPTLLEMLKVTIDALEQIKADCGDEYECVDIKKQTKAALKKCEEMVNG